MKKPVMHCALCIFVKLDLVYLTSEFNIKRYIGDDEGGTYGFSIKGFFVKVQLMILHNGENED